jgi:glycosyltransferase involved in cell wall biosynthesis
MKVGFFHPKFKHVGGAENLIVAQAQYLRGAGLDVSLVSGAVEGQLWHDAFEGVDLRRVPSGGWGDLFLSKAARIERSVPLAEALLRDRDLVIAHNFPSCAVLGSAKLTATRVWYCNEPHRQLHLVEANPRLYARIHETQTLASIAERSFAERLVKYRRAEQRRNDNLLRMREFDRTQSRRVDIICANSEYTRENVRRTYGRSDARVVYPIVRFPARGRSRAGLDRSRGLQILAHSRLDAVKNLDHVLRGFALYRVDSAGAQLHVVGMGDQRQKLQRLSQELGIAGAVRFHGFLPEAELQRVYEACDVFALTPIDEPFGMVFPEAAARGLLIVGPDHAGPLEILDGGRLGWVCDPFSPEALAENFARIQKLSDAEVDARRTLTDLACRNRYGESTIGPQLTRAIFSEQAAASSC